ncbi:Gamma-glutamylcyclotransferase [Gammaproteobacteria bacterium]
MIYSLFVYGTLKKGYENHTLCQDVVSVTKASIWGRLYTSGGIPFLDIPPSHMIEMGTEDYLADAAMQDKGNVKKAFHKKPNGDWDRIEGEVIEFSLPNPSVHDIDSLEGYRPGRTNLYSRVLAPVWIGDKRAYAWVYVRKQVEGMRRISRWPADFLGNLEMLS